jgi:hypothetical protein
MTAHYIIMLQQNGTNDYYLNVIVARMDTRDGLGNIRIAINKTFTSICIVKLLLLQE